MCHKLLFKTALLLSFTLFIGNRIAFCQDKLPVIFGEVTPADFDLPNSTAIDSTQPSVDVRIVTSQRIGLNSCASWSG